MVSFVLRERPSNGVASIGRLLDREQRADERLRGPTELGVHADASSIPQALGGAVPLRPPAARHRAESVEKPEAGAHGRSHPGGYPIRLPNRTFGATPPVMQRRAFLQASACAAAVGLPLAYVFAPREGSSTLVPDPEGLLDLPPGFRYQILGRAFDPMSDGLRAPAAPDGMACFDAPDGSWVLMRNHELDRDPADGAFGGEAPEEAYDRRAQGGVSRLVLDPRTLALRSSNMVLAGTLRNCAGGPSPWGWLTCEETLEEGHGYVFACPIGAPRVVRSAPIRGYGRFRHEAVAIDPRTHVAYLTEDEGDGCLYRFVPRRYDEPFTGQLQALCVEEAPAYSTSERMAHDRSVRVTWVDVTDADPRDGTVRELARNAGAAVVRRGEGIWYHDGAVYFTSTNGGHAGLGQVFRLRLSPGDLALASTGRRGADELDLVAESGGNGELDGPDNITVAPWGDVFVAEDGGSDQFIRAVDAEGRVREVARNARSGGELAGVCFSPDGSTLFFNLQRDGYTVAVRGPWRDLMA